MGGEERGELVVWQTKFAWIRVCVKVRLLDHPDQQKCKPKKNGNCVLNTLSVLEDSLSINVSLVLLVFTAG